MPKRVWKRYVVRLGVEVEEEVVGVVAEVGVGGGRLRWLWLSAMAAGGRKQEGKGPEWYRTIALDLLGFELELEKL